MTLNFKELIVTETDHILTVILNRPDIHNAMSHSQMIEELEAISELANSSSSIRAVIISGEGKSFCAGGNVKDMLNKTDMFAGSEEKIEEAYKTGIQRIPLAIWGIEVPVIAAVNGAAVGAGCDLAMMCDIRLGSEKARFAESFVKLGIIPGDGGAWFLPRAIGMTRASQMALTGEMIDAQKALEWGLISEVIAPDALMERAQTLAAQIAHQPPLAVRATKQLLRDSENFSLEEMLSKCAKTQSKLHQTEDHNEAVKALLEKRAGNYQGK